MPGPNCEVTVTTTPVLRRGKVVAVSTRVRFTGTSFAEIIRAWREMGSPGTITKRVDDGTTVVVWATGEFPTLGSTPAAPSPPLVVTQPAPSRT